MEGEKLNADEIPVAIVDRFNNTLLAVCFPGQALAEEAPVLNSGDTAWMLTATALVLFMTIPGLSLFYAGMVRSKNVLSVLMQCFAITSLMTVLWVIYGYSMAFGGPGEYWGGLSKSLPERCDGRLAQRHHSRDRFYDVPDDFCYHHPRPDRRGVCGTHEVLRDTAFHGHLVHRRLRPVCHWVWGEGGWLGGRGILDFAGGTVVHINAGIAGLVPLSFWANARDIPKDTCPLIIWVTP